MNGYNFTDRVRRVLRLAREEAARLHHEYVGTEHILLGLIREGEGVAATVLTNLNVDLEEISRRIEETVKKGTAAGSAGPDLPYTSRAKKILEFAMMEARELHHAYVGTEHLLLGVLREEKGIGAQVLVDAGVTLQRARSGSLSGAGHRGVGGFGHKAARSTARTVHARRAGKPATRPTGGAWLESGVFGTGTPAARCASGSSNHPRGIGGRDPGHASERRGSHARARARGDRARRARVDQPRDKNPSSARSKSSVASTCGACPVASSITPVESSAAVSRAASRGIGS